MQISIQNFRGISSAEIKTEKITLITGPNGSGKSSIAQAVGAALAGQPLPFTGLSKSGAAMLVHAGTASGSVTAETPIWRSAITYPQATRETSGTPIDISPTAAGLRSLIDEKPSDRTRIICDLLRANPDKNDLAEALAKLGIKPESADRIWQTISAQGWDAAHAQAKETGSKLKGKWEGITGENYGSKKSDSWMPKEFETDLQTATEPDLAAALKQENEWLEAAISHAAVDASEINRLRQHAEILPQLQDDKKIIEDELSGLFDSESKLQKAIRDMPRAVDTAPVSCPHCKNPIIISGGKLLKPTATAAKDNIEIAARIKESEESLAALKKEILRVNGEFAQKKSAIQQADTAVKKLSTIKQQPAATGEHSSVEDCRIRVARATARLQAYQAWKNAAAVNATINQNAVIVDILSPSGLRLERLTEAISGFNAKCDSVSSAAQWRAVQLHSDMSITYGGSPYMMLSESEKYRVRVVLQIATAMYDGSTVVIVDGADILDAVGRNGLLNAMVTFTDICSIVCMTIDNTGKLPPTAVLEKIGAVAYWIDNGIARKV